MYVVLLRLLPCSVKQNAPPFCSRHVRKAENRDVNNLDGAWGNKTAAIKFPRRLRPSDFVPNCINILHISGIFLSFHICFYRKTKIEN
jgi:hypothetical protein